MDINNIDNIDNIELNKENSNQYLEKIKIAKEGLHLILHEFKKIFVLSKMYPENEEYQQQFSNVSNSLKQILSNFFTLSNDVQINIDNISKKMIELDMLIHREREKNRELKRKLGIIEHENNASTEMISNYKEIYDMRYLRNWAIGLSTLACIAAIGIVYKKPVV
jgi:hypothetical protein